MSGPAEQLQERLPGRAAAEGDALVAEVDRLCDEAEELANTSPERGLELSRRAFEIASRADYEAGMARAEAVMGFAYYMQSDLETALTHLDRARSRSAAVGTELGRAKVLAVLALVHRSLGNFDQALSHARQGLETVRRTKDKTWEAYLLYGLGGGYQDVGDHALARRYYEQTLELIEQLPDETKQRAIIGARALDGLGTVYESLGDHARALEHELKALELFRSAGDRLGESRALNDLGLVYQSQGLYARALECLERSLELRREIGNRHAQSTSLLNVGRLHLARQDPEAALSVLHPALTLAMEIEAKPRIAHANLALAEAYEMKGDDNWALEHYRIYHRVMEEVSGDEVKARIRNMQVAWEVERAETEAELFRLRNVELKQANEELERLLGELRATQAELLESKKMAALGSLVAGVVHELNTPVAVIKSSADVVTRSVATISRLMSESEKGQGEGRRGGLERALGALEETGRMEEAVKRIVGIVERLKSFSRLDQATVQAVDINENLDNILALIGHEFEDRIELVREYGDLPPVVAAPLELNQVFTNLLSNAARAIRDEGTITLRTWTDGGFVHLRIEDSGVGMPPELVERIFEPSFTRTGSRVKAGLGLFAAYNIIRKHRGQIGLESEPGRGTAVSIMLPAESTYRSGRE